MDDLVYQSDALLARSQPGRLRPAVDGLRRDRPAPGPRRLCSRTPVGPAESVAVTRYEPQRVELVASLQHPGLVILADTYYPGWNLTIDGLPAPIYRTNRLMRGAAVKAGRHTLVYTYDPDSFRIGGRCRGGLGRDGRARALGTREKGPKARRGCSERPAEG